MSPPPATWEPGRVRGSRPLLSTCSTKPLAEGRQGRERLVAVWWAGVAQGCREPGAGPPGVGMHSAHPPYPNPRTLTWMEPGPQRLWAGTSRGLRLWEASCLPDRCGDSVHVPAGRPSAGDPQTRPTLGRTRTRPASTWGAPTTASPHRHLLIQADVMTEPQRHSGTCGSPLSKPETRLSPLSRYRRSASRAPFAGRCCLGSPQLP